MRLRRSIQPLIVLALVCCGSQALSQEASSRHDVGVWRITATDIRVGDDQSKQLTNARLASATTYIVAASVTVRGNEIVADDCEVHGANWSLPARRVRIEPATDHVRLDL